MEGGSGGGSDGGHRDASAAAGGDDDELFRWSRMGATAGMCARFGAIAEHRAAHGAPGLRRDARTKRRMNEIFAAVQQRLDAGESLQHVLADLDRAHAEVDPSMFRPYTAMLTAAREGAEWRSMAQNAGRVDGDNSGGGGSNRAGDAPGDASSLGKRPRPASPEATAPDGSAASAAPPTRQLLVIKLGGAVLSDKTTRRALRHENLAALAGAVGELYRDSASSSCDLVLLHGAGSFGHFEARQHRLNSAVPADAAAQTPLGVAACRASLAALHASVLDALVGAGVPAASAPVFPAGGLVRRRGGVDDGDGVPSLCCGYARASAGLLARGYVPVLHGDPVLADAGVGADFGCGACGGRTSSGGGAGRPPPSSSSLSSSAAPAAAGALRTSVVSGDEIARVLAAALPRADSVGAAATPRYAAVHVVFVTGAEGVFTGPPDAPRAAGEAPPRLVRAVVASPQAKETAAAAAGGGGSSSSATSAHHPEPTLRYVTEGSASTAASAAAVPTAAAGVVDVTGGITGKVAAAAAIALASCAHCSGRRADFSSSAPPHTPPRTTVSIVGAPASQPAACASALTAAARALLAEGATGGAATFRGTRVLCACRAAE